MVNQHYEPQHKPIPPLNPTNNAAPKHYADVHNESQWNDNSVNDALHKHCLMAWFVPFVHDLVLYVSEYHLQTRFNLHSFNILSVYPISFRGATDVYQSLVAKVIRSSDGCYLYDSDGKKYIDFSSQAVCSNLGHTMPEEIRTAINEQIDKVSFLYGGLAVPEIRARLSQLLSEIVPGNINAFLFPSSGSEANEAAIRIARKYTGLLLMHFLGKMSLGFLDVLKYQNRAMLVCP